MERFRSNASKATSIIRAMLTLFSIILLKREWITQIKRSHRRGSCAPANHCWNHSQAFLRGIGSWREDLTLLAAEALKCCLNFFSMAKKGQSFDQEHTGRRFDRYCWTLITRPAKFSIRAAKNSIPLKGCLDFETNSNPVVFSQFGRTNRLKNDLPRSCDRCLRKREPKKCAFAMRYKATRRYSPSISRNFERSSCGTA
ncbi:hypothetical protein BMJ29_04745 [Sinorhizobium medicae]|nr:hypothetical protein BMJ29_04745 [Sinorhizobium medicae]